MSQYQLVSEYIQNQTGTNFRKIEKQYRDYFYEKALAFLNDDNDARLPSFDEFLIVRFEKSVQEKYEKLTAEEAMTDVFKESYLKQKQDFLDKNKDRLWEKYQKLEKWQETIDAKNKVTFKLANNVKFRYEFSSLVESGQKQLRAIFKALKMLPLLPKGFFIGLYATKGKTPVPIKIEYDSNFSLYRIMYTANREFSFPYSEARPYFTDLFYHKQITRLLSIDMWIGDEKQRFYEKDEIVWEI